MDASQPIEVRPFGHDDWVVREQNGREFGHYPSAQAAEAVGFKLARKKRVELLIYAGNGKVKRRSRPRKGWLRRLFAS
jgi:hypothetical protein